MKGDRLLIHTTLISRSAFDTTLNCFTVLGNSLLEDRVLHKGVESSSRLERIVKNDV